MHRFYVEHPASAGKTAVLSSEESAHAARVLRLRPGEEISCAALAAAQDEQQKLYAKNRALEMKSN